MTGHDLIAYFQAYTNTYAPLPYLEEVYRSALSHPKVCGISIATRPDCLGPEVLALLAKLKEYSKELKEQVQAKDARLQEVGYKNY